MKFKIKTNLWSGILMTIFAIAMLLAMPSQVRIPAYDSGAPSPRIIPGIVLIGILICGVILIVESLVFKKEKIVEFDWAKEKPMVLIILMLCVYTALIIYIGFIVASLITFGVMLWYCGERKPGIYLFTGISAVVIYYLFKLVFKISLPGFFMFGG